jgi:hypothetical protein
MAGFTWLEFWLSLLVVFGVAMLLLRSLLAVQAAAERTAVEMTVMNLRSVLRVQIAQAVIRGEEARLPALAGANPVQWLQDKPVGYRGEGSSADVARLPGGGWLFDRERRELVYRPLSSEELKWPAGGQKVLRWQVRMGTATGLMRGIDLVAVEAVPWSGQPLR